MFYLCPQQYKWLEISEKQNAWIHAFELLQLIDQTCVVSCWNLLEGLHKTAEMLALYLIP